MHTTLSNDLLTIEISALGAELQSIKSVANGTEYLWQGTPEIWSGRAPILFPIVGALKNGQYEVAGNSYSMARHGFARKTHFSRLNTAADTACFELVSDAHTRKVFPWDFALQVCYTLDNNRLVIEYRVANSDKASMRFTIGSHPAFRLQEPIENYHVRFSDQETLQRFQLNDEGLLQQEGVDYPLEDQTIALTDSLFNDDVLVFKNIQSKVLSLCNKHTEVIKVHNGGAPHLGLWAKPAAPFVCIEPWFGHSDDTGASGHWLDKPAMLTLPANSNFNHQWSIEMVSVGR